MEESEVKACYCNSRDVEWYIEIRQQWRWWCFRRNWGSIGHGREEEERVKGGAQIFKFSFWIADPQSRSPFG